MYNQKTITVEDNEGDRLDVFLTRKFPESSRSYIQRLINSGDVKLNGSATSSSHSVKIGEQVSLVFHEKISEAVAQDIPLNIIHEDRDILIINKPAGLVVHPACGHESGTLVNAILGYSKGKFQPLLVHRLDKDTSGVMIVAKNERARTSIVKQFQKRVVKKTYLLIAEGRINEKKGSIDAPLGRSLQDRKKIVVGPLSKKESVTEFEVIERTANYTLVKAHPLTGRTHQIRSHFAYIGHPIVGDETYGGRIVIDNKKFKRQMLHAYTISFTHPSLHKTISFQAPVPGDMKKYFKNLRAS
jgi:23S rRNA pseudouridine1911/1915/1917 synthase